MSEFQGYYERGVKTESSNAEFETWLQRTKERLKAMVNVERACWGMDSLKKLGSRLAELLDADHWNNIEPLLLNIEEGLKRANAEAEPISGPNVQTTCFDDNSGGDMAWHKLQDQIDAWAQQTLPPDHAAAIMSWSDRLAQHLVTCASL